MIASWFEGYELGQTLGDSGRQGGLACCSPWGHKESDMTERLNKQTTPSPNIHTSANLDPTSKETRRSFDCFTLTVHVCLGTQSFLWLEGDSGVWGQQLAMEPGDPVASARQDTPRTPQEHHLY